MRSADSGHPSAWEDAVRWLRAQPDMQHVVRGSYLGEDVAAEAERYAASDEFAEALRIVRRYVSRRLATVVDLGCGNGIASYAFASAGYQAIALDPDTSATVGLRAVRTLTCEGILPVAASAEDTPLRSGSVDAIFARQALHHFRDLGRGLHECARALVGGGVMLAIREHVADDAEQLRAFLDHHPLHHRYGGEHAFRLGEYLGAARDAGLEAVEVLGPYDTEMNLHPRTRHDARREAVAYLARKVGRPAARVALSCRPVLDAYLRRMSRFDRTPGRLYSFVFVKRGSHP